MLLLGLWMLVLGCEAKFLGDPLLNKIEQDHDSHFLNMPSEVMWMIMENVDYFSLLKLAVVSDQFEVWVDLFQKLFPRKTIDIKGQRKLINDVKDNNMIALVELLGTSVYDLEFLPIHSGVQEISVLVRAVKIGNLEVVKTLVKHGAKVSFQAIEASISTKKLDILLFLLQMEKVYVGKYNGSSVLMRACKEHWSLNDLRIILGSEIIKEGLKVADFMGRTPLHFSIEISPAAVRLLLEAGADVNALDNLDQNALHRVIQTVQRPEYRIVLVDLFAEYDLDMIQQDWEGNSPLHVELKRYDRQSLEVVGRLLKFGSNPHLPNKKGQSPISIVRYRQSQEFVEAMEKYNI